MALTKIDNHLGEEIYSGLTSSGLNFILNPKPAFSKTMGVFGVRFGSTDCAFNFDDQKVEVPDGTAHFLEHKLFEDKEGDVSDRFSANGASCNAGTGFTTTSYLFTSTNKTIENLKLLLDFVQTPYFTPQLIAKEQGIISQEIKMYNDDPEWIVFFNLMKRLYKDHPVRNNIAGSIESIGRIDTDVLHRCYKAYYRPGNMCLVLAGRMDLDEIEKVILEDGSKREVDEKPLMNRRSIKDIDPSTSGEPIVQNMVVSRPKILLGFKDKNPKSDGAELQGKEIITQMVIDILFGKSSLNYEDLYESETIDDSFSAYYSGYMDFGFTIFGVDTNQPQKFKERVAAILERAITEGIDAASFERQKRKYLGKFIRTFNSIETTAFSLLNFFFKQIDPVKVIQIIEKIQLNDLNIRLENHFIIDEMACSVIEPSGSETT